MRYKARIACAAMLWGGAAAAQAPADWDTRLRAQRVEVAQLARLASAATAAFMAGEDAAGVDVAQAEAAGVFAATRAAARARGSVEVLDDWVAFRRSRPGGGAATAWIEARSARLAGQLGSLAASQANLQALAAEQQVNAFGLVIGLERLFAMASYTEGAARELQAIEADAGARARLAGIADGLARRQSALGSWGLACGRTLSPAACRID